MWMEALMPDDFLFTSAIHQTANALNPPEGYDPTADAMAHQLAREQHDFYTSQQAMQSTPPGGHDFSLQGIKEFAYGVGALLALGLFLKYIVGVG
jgi:hypothetical protein